MTKEYRFHRECGEAFPRTGLADTPIHKESRIKTIFFMFGSFKEYTVTLVTSEFFLIQRPQWLKASTPAGCNMATMGYPQYFSLFYTLQDAETSFYLKIWWLQ